MSARSTFDSSVFARNSAVSTRWRSPRSWSAVADDYEQALRETDQLRQELMRTEAALAQHREHEKNLQSTLTTAQKLSDDIRANAQKLATTSGPTPRWKRPDHPRRRRTVRTAAREDAGAARGHPARDRRPEAQAPRRGDVARSDDLDAEEHPRVRPRAGSARARGQDPASTARASPSSRTPRRTSRGVRKASPDS